MINLKFDYTIKMVVKSTCEINDHYLRKNLEPLFFSSINYFIGPLSYSEDKTEVLVTISHARIRLLNAGMDIESKITHLNNALRKAIPGCTIDTEYIVSCNLN